jgi:hypothetical protein
MPAPTRAAASAPVPRRVEICRAAAVAHLGDEIRALPPAARRQVDERMRFYVDLIRGTIYELKAAERLRDVDPTVAPFSVLGMILWLPRWFRQGGRLSQEQVAKEIATLALGGLARSRAKLQVHRAAGSS